MLTKKKKNAHEQNVQNMGESKTKNKQANALIEDLNNNKISPIDALHVIFDIYAAGTNFKARYNNGLKFVEYLNSILHDKKIPKTGREGAQKYICTNYRTVIDVYKDTLKKGESMPYEDAIDASQDNKLGNMTLFILTHWDLIGNSTYTYRTLVGITEMIKGVNTDKKDKKTLIKIITELSQKWDE